VVRIGRGEAKDLEVEKKKAIEAFERAIELQTQLAEKNLLTKTFKE
jgi:hypothetical protein